MNKKICPSCGYVGKPIKITKGSVWIELLLWLCVFVPGILYSLWRLSTRAEGCPKCQGMTMIPLDSPIGKKLAGELAGSVR